MSKAKKLTVLIVLIAAFSFTGCFDFGDEDDPSGACVYNSGLSNICRDLSKSECSDRGGVFYEGSTCHDLLE